MLPLQIAVNRLKGSQPQQIFQIHLDSDLFSNDGLESTQIQRTRWPIVTVKFSRIGSIPRKVKIIYPLESR